MPHSERFLQPPRFSIPDIIGDIQRFDKASSEGPDGLYSSLLQALLKNSEGEDPTYNFYAELIKSIQRFLEGKIPQESAEHPQQAALRS